MVSDNADGGIDAVTRMDDLVRQHGSVAVPDHVRPPFLRQLQRQLLISGFPGKRKAAFCL